MTNIAQEVAAGMTVQTIAETTYMGVIGYRATCSACHWKSGTNTEAQAVAEAKRHGKRAHS